jgi:hypothetical protein
MIWHMLKYWHGHWRRWKEPQAGGSIQVQDLYTLALGFDGEERKTIDLEEVPDAKHGRRLALNVHAV